jgi:hypothetical protein
MLSVRLHTLLRGILAMALLAFAGAAQADLVDPEYTMVFSAAACDDQGVCGELVEMGGVNGPHDPGGTGTDTGYYSLNDVTLGGVAFIDHWDSAYDIDPFVTNNFNVTNISGVTQVFDILVTSPVVVTGPQTLMTGSIGLSVTNTASGGATLTDTGVAVYQALIDGVTVETLFDPAFTLTCAPPFCSDTDNAMFTNQIGPQANANIGIRIRFTLSPGDSASGTSVFNIEAVPEPVTAMMLGMGLVGLAIAGSRHRS